MHKVFFCKIKEFIFTPEMGYFMFLKQKAAQVCLRLKNISLCNFRDQLFAQIHTGL